MPSGAGLALGKCLRAIHLNIRNFADNLFQLYGNSFQLMEFFMFSRIVLSSLVVFAISACGHSEVKETPAPAPEPAAAPAPAPAPAPVVAPAPGTCATDADCKTGRCKHGKCD